MTCKDSVTAPGVAQSSGLRLLGVILPNCWPGPVGTVGRLDPTSAA